MRAAPKTAKIRTSHVRFIWRNLFVYNKYMLEDSDSREQDQTFRLVGLLAYQQSALFCGMIEV